MLVRQWIRVLRQFCVLLNVVTHFLRQGGTSDPEVFPRPALQLFFGEACTVDASVGLPCFFFARGNWDTICMSLL